ncbi:MAG: hypothetical protein WCL11_27180 [Verrucomicrobiota bacterium]
MKENISNEADLRSRSISVMKLVRSYALLIAAFALCDRTLLAQGLLADPGFESGGMVAGGVGGWEIKAGSPVFTHNFVRSGSWSLQESYFFGSDAYVVDQWVAAQPGSQYTLSGWSMTPIRLVNDRVGYLVLTFCNSSHVAIGQGIRSSTISSSTPANSWVPLSVTATAPAGTVYARVSVSVPLVQILSPASNAIYYDDLSLAVPEPSSQALLVATFSGWLWLRSRKKGGAAELGSETTLTHKGSTPLVQATAASRLAGFRARWGRRA